MTKAIPRLLVLGSTFPATPGDGVPGFVRDLSVRESTAFDVLVLTPAVPRAARRETIGPVAVRRFRYFPRRYEDLAAGAIIENLHSRPSRWLQVLPLMAAEYLAVVRAVRTFRPDVIHAHWIIPQGLVAMLAAPHVPRLVTTHGGDLYALNAPVLRWLKGRVVRSARTVTAMNEEMADVARALGGRDVRVRSMGADLATFRPIALRREPRTTGDLRVVFVGRLVEKKGLSVLLDALPAVSANVTLTVVGDGPLRGALEARARGAPVRFLGQLGRERLVEVYAAHDVAVAPSVVAASGDKDGLPVALLEAMGAGLAVVASRLPGIDEAIEDGTSGLLVPPGDPAALARAVDHLAADRDDLVRLSGGAAARAEAYGIDAVGDTYVTILDEMIRRPDGR